MRFAIYIPGDTTANEQKLVAVGLAHLASGCSAMPTPTGPDGKGGVVFCWPTNDPRSNFGYLPEQQEWIPAVPYGDQAAARYWVGFTIGNPPRSSELARPQQVAGARIALGDGSKWMLPAARHLPKDSRLTPDGTWSFVVQDHWADYFQDSYAWYSRLAQLLVPETDADAKISIDASAPDYLANALSINYLLTREVVDRMNLFPTPILLSAILATVDGHELQDELEAQKKSPTLPAI